jgi:hypothetical protein
VSFAFPHKELPGGASRRHPSGTKADNLQAQKRGPPPLGGCAPQKPLQVTICMTPGRNSVLEDLHAGISVFGICRLLGCQRQQSLRNAESNPKFNIEMIWRNRRRFCPGQAWLDARERYNPSAESGSN